MARQPTRWGRTLIAIVLPLTLLAAACAKDDNKDSKASSGDSSGKKVVKIFGPEVKQEAQGFLNSFKAFEQQTGIDVQYQGDRSFEEQIGVRVDGGDPPDIAMFPQPGKVKDFKDDLKALSSDVTNEMKDNFDPGWTKYVTFDDKVYAVPAKADLKSLVWYSPAAFKAAGYQVPTTQAEFIALMDKMIADGKTPLC